MKIFNINSYQNNTKYFTNFRNNNVISESAMKLYDLNLEAMVGYSGEKRVALPPPNLDERLVNFLNKMDVNWDTYVTKITKPNSSFNPLKSRRM